MTSKECFVYLQLPNSHEIVTVGRLKWERAGENTEHGVYIYGRKYLDHTEAFSLDPFKLPLEEKEFVELMNEGIHGPIRDASPDSWGRYVIQKNTSPEEHDPIGYLLNSAEDRVGALSFGYGKVPPPPVRRFNKTVDLRKLIEAAHKLEKDQPVDETEKLLLMAGASLGGARPKATVEDKNELWLAKFPGIDDKQNFPRIEYATMCLADSCGLNIPQVRLIQIGQQDVFLIKRFDREYDKKNRNYFRTHFVSGLTILGLDEKDHQKWSYLELADQMRRWVTDSDQDLEELFRRIVFNGLVSNTDDHPRNHGFLYSTKGYRLSPLYDVVPKPESGSQRYLAMPFGDKGRVFDLENLLSQSSAFNLSVESATSIFYELKKKVSKWEKFFFEQQVSVLDMKYLKGAFSHWEFLE